MNMIPRNIEADTWKPNKDLVRKFLRQAFESMERVRLLNKRNTRMSRYTARLNEAAAAYAIECARREVLGLYGVCTVDGVWLRTSAEVKAYYQS